MNLLEALQIKHEIVDIHPDENPSIEHAARVLQVLERSPNFDGLWDFLGMEHSRDFPSESGLALLSAIGRAMEARPHLVLAGARPWSPRKQRTRVVFVDREFLARHFHEARELPYVNLLATPLRAVYRRAAYVADYDLVDRIFRLLGLGPYRADGLALGLPTEGPGRLRRDPERGRMYQFRAWTGRGVAKGLVLELEPRRWLRAYERARGEVRRVLEHLIRTHGVLLTPDTVKTGFQEGPAELVMGETNVWLRRTKIALSNQVVQLLPPDRSRDLARLVIGQIDRLLDHLRSPEGLYELAAGRLKAAAAAGRPYLLGGRLSALEIAAASAAVDYTGKAREKLASGDTPLPGELVVPTVGVKRAIERLLVDQARRLVRRFGLSAPGGITVVCADGYEERWWRLGVLAIPERAARVLNADSDGDYVGALVARYGDRKVIMALRYPLVGPPAFFMTPANVRTPWDASESEAVRALFDLMGVRIEGDEVRHDLLDVGSAAAKQALEQTPLEGDWREAPVVALRRVALCRTGQLTRLYERLIARYWQEPDKRDLLAERIRHAARCIEQQVTALKKRLVMERPPELALTVAEADVAWHEEIPTDFYEELRRVRTLEDLGRFGSRQPAARATREERVMRVAARYAALAISAAVDRLVVSMQAVAPLLDLKADPKQVALALQVALYWAEAWSRLADELGEADDEEAHAERRAVWQAFQRQLDELRRKVPAEARAQAAYRLLREGRETIAFHLLGVDLARLVPRRPFQVVEVTSDRRLVVFVPGARFEPGQRMRLTGVRLEGGRILLETEQGTLEAQLADGELRPERLDFKQAVATTRTRLVLQ